jgi:hypothetical protein
VPVSAYEECFKGALVDVHLVANYSTSKMSLRDSQLSRLTFFPSSRSENFFSGIHSITVLRKSGHGGVVASPAKWGLKLPKHLQVAKKGKV